MYFRHRRDHYGVGSYQHRSMPVSPDEIPRWGEAEVIPSVMRFTPDTFEGPWQDAQELMPALRNAGMEQPFNGLFSFTPAKVRSDGGRQVLWSLRYHRRRRGGDGQRDRVLSCAEGAAGAWPGAVRPPARDGLLP
jgi:hypothetical protein